MSIWRSTFTKTGFLTSAAVLALLAFGPYASATVVRINFSGIYDFGNNIGTPFSGYADLTLGTDPSASGSFPTPPENAPPTRVDPEYAQSITGATGMFNGVAFSDAGVMSATGGCPPPTEYLPASCTALIAANTPDGAPAVTFDNLFYLSGSPLVCLGINPDGSTYAIYPFAGGFLDTYGVLLTLSDGTLVDLWSNGYMPGGLNYGAILLAPAGDNYAVLDAQFNGVFAAVPEPDFVWLLGAGLLGLFVWRRAVEVRKRKSRSV